MRTISLSFLFSITIIISAAQQNEKSANSLLWRISGNGLKKPSYLYGTMHLTDKRLFNFSDSLYHFIETTDGFAAEVDMGAMMPQLVTEMRSRKNELIKDVVRNEWLTPYKKRLEKLLEKKLDEITIQDIKSAKSKYATALLRSGEMSTFMDVYLYDIALRQGKWVGGIEDFEDQFNHIDSEEDLMGSIYFLFSDRTVTDKQVEWMISIYLKQQLDSIDLSNNLWKGAESDILIRRNIKMARRIDSIMQLRTCFFAVGAAHLPGESGLVTLLRSKGFKVESVYSAKKIEAGKYKFTPKEIPWVTSDVQEGLYSLQMPGKPEQMDLGNDNIPPAQIYFDLTRLNYYFTFNFSRTENKKTPADSIFNGMARNFARQGKVISSRAIEVNGVRGKEFIIKSDENDMRMQAFLPPGAAIINIMAAMKFDSLFGKDATRYFQSFQLKGTSAKAEATPDWQRYSFPQHAFSIKFPAKFKQLPKKLIADSSWWSTTYSASLKGGLFSPYMIVMESTKGYYSNSDSTLFESVRSNILESLKADTVESSRQSLFNGYPAYEFTAIQKSDEVNVGLSARIINRGSRRYYFYCAYNDEGNNRMLADSFLHSFEFLPLAEGKWRYETSPKKDLAIWSPSPITYQHNEDTTDASAGYILYDSLSPASTIIEKQQIPEYSWWKNDSSFFRQFANGYAGNEGDSLIDFRTRIKGNIPEADFSVKLTDNHLIKRVHLLLNGDSIYGVFGFFQKELVESENYRRLFNEIKILNPKSPSDYLVNKTEAILKDIATGDSITFEKASAAIDEASFAEEDLPLLQKGLLVHYRDFDTSFYYGTHQRLNDKVVELDNGSLLSFIKNNYPLLKESRQELEYPFLYSLLALRTKESFASFKEIVTNKLPVVGNPMILQYQLKDSLALTASIFPALLPLSADTNFIKLLTPVASSLLDSGLLPLNKLEPYKKNFFANAARALKGAKGNDEDYDPSISNAIIFLSHFKEPASYKLLQQFTTLPDIYTKKQAVVALLENNQQVDAIQLEKIAKDDYYRLSLYHNLEELKKTKLFPAKYYTQKYIAQSEVCQIASDDDEPESVTFVAEKLMKYRGKQQKFYLFKVVYKYDEGETVSYLGIAGPYQKAGGKIILESEVSGLYTEEQYDKNKLTEQLQAHLKSIEEYYENKEKEESED